MTFADGEKQADPFPLPPLPAAALTQPSPIPSPRASAALPPSLFPGSGPFDAPAPGPGTTWSPRAVAPSWLLSA
jgi:hypothetical protein